jgi:hypothetical protein
MNQQQPQLLQVAACWLIMAEPHQSISSSLTA